MLSRNNVSSAGDELSHHNGVVERNQIRASNSSESFACDELLQLNHIRARGRKAAGPRGRPFLGLPLRRAERGAKATAPLAKGARGAAYFLLELHYGEVVHARSCGVAPPPSPQLCGSEERAPCTPPSVEKRLTRGGLKQERTSTRLQIFYFSDKQKHNYNE